MKKYSFILSLIILFAPLLSPAQKVDNKSLSEWSWQVLPTAMAELDGTLRIPNNALVEDDVAKTIAWTTKAFEKSFRNRHSKPFDVAQDKLCEESSPA